MTSGLNDTVPHDPELLVLLPTVAYLNLAAGKVSPNSRLIKLLPVLCPIHVFPSAKYMILSSLKNLWSKECSR